MIDILVVGHSPILFVNRRFYRALLARGWNIEMAVPEYLPHPRVEVEPLQQGDPPMHRLPPLGSHYRFWTFKGLPELIAARKPKLVILENEPDSRMACQIGALQHRRNGTLVCISNENDLPPPVSALLAGQFKPALRSLRSRIWSLLARRRVDHVFSICNDGVASMEALGFRGRVTKIPLGYDPKLFRRFSREDRDSARRELGIEGPVIAYFGRVAPNKGIHILIEALGSLRDDKWQFMLDAFLPETDGYAASLESALAEQNISDRVIHFHAGHGEMPRMMNAADIVVVPSIWKEQYGRVVPEAMACARAVVVSDAGAMPELLGGCGVVVPAGDSHALASAIKRLLEDEQQRERLGKAAAERAASVLTVGAQVDISEPVFRKLTGGGPL